jgi:hypothetical protein
MNTLNYTIIKPIIAIRNKYRYSDRILKSEMSKLATPVDEEGGKMIDNYQDLHQMHTR